MKVVINRCYGGFSLSHLAVKEYLKRKGKDCFFYENNITKPYKKIIEPDEKSMLVSYSTKDLGNVTTWENLKDFHFSCRDIDRDDEDLIAVVELLGKKASGRFSDLTIVEIPDGIYWEISEYDGLETVEEKHRSWF